MSQYGHPGPDTRGAWSVEPVHDAVVSARLDHLRNGHGDVFDGHEAIVHAAAPVTPALPPSVHSGWFRALRIRLGRALVAVGSAIEGPCDCPEGAAKVGA